MIVSTPLKYKAVNNHLNAEVSTSIQDMIYL